MRNCNSDNQYHPALKPTLKNRLNENSWIVRPCRRMGWLDLKTRFEGIAKMHYKLPQSQAAKPCPENVGLRCSRSTKTGLETALILQATIETLDNLPPGRPAGVMRGPSHSDAIGGSQSCEQSVDGILHHSSAHVYVVYNASTDGGTSAHATYLTALSNCQIRAFTSYRGHRAPHGTLNAGAQTAVAQTAHKITLAGTSGGHRE